MAWRLTMAAALFASALSYLLLLAAVWTGGSHHNHQSQLTSIALQTKETLFALVDEQWRIRGRDDELSCEEIARMTDSMRYIGSGWTKAVYEARTGENRRVAVKMVDMTGRDMNQCLREGPDDIQSCYQRAADKLIKEIAVLKLLLDHPNVVKIVGYCVPNRMDWRSARLRVSLVTELGQPVDLIRLLQMSWEDRLRMVWSVTSLMHYLSGHPAGSLVLNDMRRQQFVIGDDGDLKLVDVDDIGLEEPPCRDDTHCQQYLNEMMGVEQDNISIRCDDNKVCSGANEIRNMYNSARHFSTFVLAHGAPPQLRSDIDHLVASFKQPAVPAGRLRQRIENLVHRYSTGAYLIDNEKDRTGQRFVECPDSDTPGQFDYPCEGSFSQIGCSLSVANLVEARRLCAAQPTCRAFVWMNEKTWTGRTVVHFKNGVGSPSRRPNATLFIKMVD